MAGGASIVAYSLFVGITNIKEMHVSILSYGSGPHICRTHVKGSIQDKFSQFGRLRRLSVKLMGMGFLPF